MGAGASGNPEVYGRREANRILIVDDDIDLTAILAEYMNSEGFHADVSMTGNEGAERAIRGDYSATLLDVMLPDVSGLEVLRTIRAHSEVPVVMLTARAQDVDRIVGLEMGADDYIRKPFVPRELVARLHAILRRTQRASRPSQPALLKAGDVELDQRARVARRGSRLIRLTSVEFELLRMLLSAPGVVVSRNEISRSVLGREISPFDRSVDNHISALRRKLGKGPGGLDRIQSVRNVGYVFTCLK
jgi:DNA-binding response OmpR family regulator